VSNRYLLGLRVQLRQHNLRLLTDFAKLGRQSVCKSSLLWQAASRVNSKTIKLKLGLYALPLRLSRGAAQADSNVTANDVTGPA
jgi:hypothetical protein